VAPLLGNQCCHGNRFMPHLLGGRQTSNSMDCGGVDH